MATQQQEDRRARAQKVCSHKWGKDNTKRKQVKGASSVNAAGRCRKCGFAFDAIETAKRLSANAKLAPVKAPV